MDCLRKIQLIGVSGRAFSRKEMFRDTVRPPNEEAYFSAVRLPVAAVHRRSRQKPRFLPAATELLAEKAPQATFSN
jgi:hypothetical protein